MFQYVLRIGGWVGKWQGGVAGVCVGARYKCPSMDEHAISCDVIYDIIVINMIVPS